MSSENVNLNKLEGKEIPKPTVEQPAEQVISEQEFKNEADQQEKDFKNETVNESAKLNSYFLDADTFDKVKNETNIESELAKIDKEAEKIVRDSKSEIFWSKLNTFDSSTKKEQAKKELNDAVVDRIHVKSLKGGENLGGFTEGELTKEYLKSGVFTAQEIEDIVKQSEVVENKKRLEMDNRRKEHLAEAAAIKYSTPKIVENKLNEDVREQEPQPTINSQEPFLRVEQDSSVDEPQKEINQEIKDSPDTEQEKMKKVTENVSKLYIDLANKHLDEKSPLKEKIINFYSDLGRLQGELAVVFKGLNEEGINKKIEEVKERLNDRTFFVEHYQKIFERTEVSNGIKNRMIKNPRATQEEYDLGVYREGLETQVRDACFSMYNKGYKTFESGFREKDGDRDQYIGMYNKNINIPKSLIDYFKENHFEISIIRQDDRTLINMHPIGSEAVTLNEWKKVWDDLARGLPSASEEDFSDNKEYLLHTSFRERQNRLRFGVES